MIPRIPNRVFRNGAKAQLLNFQLGKSKVPFGRTELSVDPSTNKSKKVFFLLEGGPWGLEFSAIGTNAKQCDVSFG